jgi:homoserine acetyltransferase
MLIRPFTVLLLMLMTSAALAQTSKEATWPNQREGDFIIKDYRFASGETLAELRIHYTTIGTAKRNGAGEIVNGVLLMTESVVQLQEQAPSREAADALYQKMVERAKKADANDRLYQTEAVMDYDPSKDLEKIKARLLAINFADDAVNAFELDVLAPAIKRIPNAKYVIVPAGPQTHGHFTHLRAAVWKKYLIESLKELPPQQM